MTPHTQTSRSEVTDMCTAAVNTLNSLIYTVLSSLMLPLFSILSKLPVSGPPCVQMYSCGSLAPKMRRGGCMDTHFHKPAEPWEKTEG